MASTFSHLSGGQWRLHFHKPQKFLHFCDLRGSVVSDVQRQQAAAAGLGIVLVPVQRKGLAGVKRSARARSSSKFETAVK